MLVSVRWLKDYVDLDISPGEIADKLTMAGLEVDAIQESGPAFSGLVVSKILSVKPHPNADKLSLCDVSIGSETVPVVCGAPNVKEGILVPLAKVGAEIPGGYTIKRSKIRGEVSEGMLCSEEELELGDDASGIMVLPDSLTVGQDLAEALDLKDVTLDVAITPNRSDCLSIIGIARELAALTGKKVKYPDISFTEADEDVNDVTSVDIIDPVLCPRYTARIIKNITVKPSPFWMRIRLEAVGLRAINNVVDVTNFVMMEFGQPLHSFDYRYLEKGRIVVRGAEEGEAFVSLDEKTRTLSADTLMICDGVKPVAVAGIMGGLNSEVVEDTDTVLLESAYFNPSSIRKSARNLGMSTDAAFRFERGIDPEGVLRASARAAQLMAELGDGTVCKGCIDEYPGKIKTARDIPLRVEYVNQILGTDIDADAMVSTLEALEMEVHKEETGLYRVTPPTFRVDIYREVDLIEEISRILGYDTIPVTLPPPAAGTDVKEEEQVLSAKIRDVFNGCGYTEIINYSFTSPESANALKLPGDHEGRKFVAIRNPLTEDMSVMRTTMVYGFLETVRRNIYAGNPHLKMFEMGRIFIDSGTGDLPEEKERLSGGVTGSRYNESWHFKEEPADFYDLKGCLENLFDMLKIDDVSYRSGGAIPFLHPGRCCEIMAGSALVGFMGEVHPAVLENMDLKTRVSLFELDLSVLFDLVTESIRYKEIPRFPSTSRDVAFVVERSREGASLIGLARDRNQELLEDVRIFDVYSGKGIPADMKSIALRFTYRSPVKTLTDAEVNEVHDRLVERIVQETGARIRGSEC